MNWYPTFTASAAPPLTSPWVYNNPAHWRRGA